jgi:threonine/homoserine/homoserine lactone efflux protein
MRTQVYVAGVLLLCFFGWKMGLAAQARFQQTQARQVAKLEQALSSID